jgi:hypothetical protein
MSANSRKLIALPRSYVRKLIVWQERLLLLRNQRMEDVTKSKSVMPASLKTLRGFMVTSAFRS